MAGSTLVGTATPEFPSCEDCTVAAALRQLSPTAAASLIEACQRIGRPGLERAGIQQPVCAGAIGKAILRGEVTPTPSRPQMPGQLPSERLGERLRQARLARNLTQSEIAQSQFSVSYIQAVERGQIRPSFGALERLAERLGVPVADLLSAESGQGGVQSSQGDQGSNVVPFDPTARQTAEFGQEPLAEPEQRGDEQGPDVEPPHLNPEGENQ